MVKNLCSPRAYGVFIQGEQHGIASIWLFEPSHRFISQHRKPEEGKQTTNVLAWYPQWAIPCPDKHIGRQDQKKKIIIWSLCSIVSDGNTSSNPVIIHLSGFHPQNNKPFSSKEQLSVSQLNVLAERLVLLSLIGCLKRTQAATWSYKCAAC